MAAWNTPSAIHSFCGEHASYPAVNSMDDDTETYWIHYVEPCLHWIIFDMGETKDVTQIRLYQDDDYEAKRWGAEFGLYVYVSDDLGAFGDAVWEGVLNAGGWQESGAFEKSGRYVKLVSKDSARVQRMYEFDAYCNGAPPGLSIPVAMHHYGHHISKIIRG